MERVMIFIDGSNFDYAKKELFQETGEPVPKIDYGKFARKLAGDNRILLKRLITILPSLSGQMIQLHLTPISGS